LKVRKAVLTSFTIFTLAMSILLLYTMYAFIGISMSIRVINVSTIVSVQSLNATVVNVQTVITIKNPSEFSFGAIDITEYIYFDNTPVGSSKGYRSIYHTPLPIEPFGETNVTMTMSTVLLPKNYSASLKWRISGLIVLKTSLPNLARVRFLGDAYPST
jgi:hypothetical protein